MAYLPDHTGHRVLKALSQSPKCMADLRDITHPVRAASTAKINGYQADGLICRASKFSKWVLTDMGREALVVLNSGKQYTPVRPGVRVFISQGGAGANNLRAEG